MNQIIRESLKQLEIFLPEGIDFNILAMSNSTAQGTLSFLDTPAYLDQLNQNHFVTGVICTPELAPLITSKFMIQQEDPRWLFYTLHNLVARNRVKKKSIIHPTANIHPTAFVAEHNVEIGAHCIIGPQVSILEDVYLGDHVVVGAGTVVGAEGFEHKRTSKGILSVLHDGRVLLRDRVELGANNAVSKGFAYRDTIVGLDTKTDNLVHIAHCVQIGERCLLPAGCVIAGSVTLENDVWIGPNATISSGLHIGNKGYVTLGSTVTRNVGEGEKVSGFFAIEHARFLEMFKRNLNSGS